MQTHSASCSADDDMGQKRGSTRNRPWGEPHVFVCLYEDFSRKIGLSYQKTLFFCSFVVFTHVRVDARNKINQLNTGQINLLRGSEMDRAMRKRFCERKAFRRAANAAAEAVFCDFVGFFKVVVLVKKCSFRV